MPSHIIELSDEEYEAVQWLIRNNDPFVGMRSGPLELRSVTRARGASLMVKFGLMATEYFAEHWRDDDSPQAESTFGVHKEAARAAREKHDAT